MIKLVATDIDGTLIRESSSVLPEEIFDLIRELRKRVSILRQQQEDSTWTETTVCSGGRSDAFYQ